jgi:hypothetical protein
MESVAVIGVGVGVLAVKALALFAVVYLSARLAIRHERRISN